MNTAEIRSRLSRVGLEPDRIVISHETKEVLARLQCGNLMPLDPSFYHRAGIPVVDGKPLIGDGSAPAKPLPGRSATEHEIEQTGGVLANFIRTFAIQ